MGKNIIANILGRFWSIISNFLFIPIYIKYLGFENYSIISFSLVITSIISFLDVGLTSTLSREFARADQTENQKRICFQTLESIYFSITAIAISIIFLSSKYIANDWLSSSLYSKERLVLYFKILSFDIGFQFLFRFYIGGFLGLNQQIKANLFIVCWGVVRNGLVIIDLFYYRSLEHFFIWQSVSTFIFSFFVGVLLRRQVIGRISLIIYPIQKFVLLRTWKFAGGMFLISVVAILNMQLDKLAISKLLPLQNLGYYTIAVSISMAILTLINPISSSLLPVFTSLYSQKKYEDASKLFISTSLIVSIIVFSVSVNMIFFSREFIWIWTNDMNVSEKAGSLLPIISFGAAMLALQVLPFNIAIANGYTKLNNIIGILSLLITIPGYWFATTKFGEIGAASIFCSIQAGTTFVYLYILNKKFKIVSDFWNYSVQSVFLPILIAIITSLFFSYLILQMNMNRPYLFICISLSILTSFGISLFMILKRSGIESILRLFY